MTATPSALAPGRRHQLQAGLGVLLVCVLTYLLVRLSLDDVPGVTRRTTGPVGDRCCDTSFVNTGWWYASGILCAPIWGISRAVPWAAVPALGIAVYATFHVASTTIGRYQSTGWGDGLESLSYVISVLHTMAFSLAAVVGALSARRRRRRRDHETRHATAPGRPWL